MSKASCSVPLPFPGPSRLAVLADRLEGTDLRGDGGGADQAGVTAPDIRAYTRETSSFTAPGGNTFSSYERSGAGDAVEVNAIRLTSGVFPTPGGGSPSWAASSRPTKTGITSRWPC